MKHETLRRVVNISVKPSWDTWSSSWNLPWRVQRCQVYDTKLRGRWHSWHPLWCRVGRVSVLSVFSTHRWLLPWNAWQSVDCKTPEKWVLNEREMAVMSASLYKTTDLQTAFGACCWHKKSWVLSCPDTLKGCVQRSEVTSVNRWIKQWPQSSRTFFPRLWNH